MYVVWNILDGGALGVLAGGFAFLANVRIFTNDGATVANRYANSALTMVAFLAGSLILSIGILLLLA